MNNVHQAVSQVKPVAFTFGAQDAISGERCVPEIYFCRIVDKCDYCKGFESISGPTLTTRQILDLYGDAHIEDTLDLEDAIIETEYLRSWH